jgi:aminoglycoside phosphotransferase (APT) family kinase protein
LPVELRLSLDEAEALHAALEEMLEEGRGDPRLERSYRVRGWRILAVRGGTGLTGRLAELAREAESLEEYEAARERALGPILDGLESSENRDP